VNDQKTSRKQTQQLKKNSFSSIYHFSPRFFHSFKLRKGCGTPSLNCFDPRHGNSRRETKARPPAGVEGLAEMAKQLEEGHHVAFTIDGPRGPRYVAKPGPVILARRSGAPISVFHIGVQRGYTFKRSWDLFQLPFPFSRTVMFCAPPIRVPTDADSDTMKQKQAEMQAALERVRDLAESWFKLTEAEQDKLRADWRERIRAD
jgi:Domain of unknown function (DUF374)